MFSLDDLITDCQATVKGGKDGKAAQAAVREILTDAVSAPGGADLIDHR